MTKIRNILVGIVPALFVAGCASSPQQLKVTLNEHPELVLDVIEKNPVKFTEVLQKATNEYRRINQAKAEADEKAQRDEEYKNPQTADISADRAIRGNKSAPITIVEYSDFQCPYCQRGYFTVEELRKKYGEKLRIVFKHLPLDFHPLAMPAAKYFEAIAMQDSEKAYRFHDEIFNQQQKFTQEGDKFLMKTARKLGVNMARLKKDLTSNTVKARIQADMEEAQKLGIVGTPGFLVGGVTLKGAYPTSAFEEIIERRLSEQPSAKLQDSNPTKTQN